MSKNILFVLTSDIAVPKIGPNGSDWPTGWYLPELAHPYMRFIKAGWKATIASIKGGATAATPASLENPDDESKEFWDNPELKAQTFATKPLSEFSGKNFDIVFFVGGAGTMFDFRQSEEASRIARENFENGGTVAAVCHGPIVYGGIRLSSGKFLIEGRPCTGFTNNEEKAVGGLDAHFPVHESGGKTCSEILSAVGAQWSEGPDWAPYVVGGDRVYAGQNPASAALLADTLLKAQSH